VPGDGVGAANDGIDHGIRREMKLIPLRGAALSAVGALAFGFCAPAALGKDARCFTTDDGQYPCDFQSFGGDGSFTISAPGKPTFTLSMTGAGAASASAVFEPGGRSVPLPGPFRRDAADAACWTSDSTGARVCAW
jgi:hypothetical protein